MARTKTTVLLTVDEADEALSKPVSYEDRHLEGAGNSCQSDNKPILETAPG
jgi:hypothetical protein